MKFVNLLLFLSLTTTPFFSSLEGCFGACSKKSNILPLVRDDVGKTESRSWLSTAFKKVRQKVVSVLPTTKRSQLLLSAVVGAAIVTYLMLRGEDPTPILEQCPVLQEDFLSLMGYDTEQCGRCTCYGNSCGRRIFTFS